MNIVVSLFVGIFIGWIASTLSRTAGREDLVRNLTAGVAGAFLGSWLLGKMAEPVTTGDFSVSTMAASAFGAAALLFVVDRFKKA